jgi:hypothetical protein
MRCTSTWAKVAYATGIWDPPRVTADLQPSDSDPTHVATLDLQDNQHCFSHWHWLRDVMRDVASTKGFSAGPRFQLKVERFENSDFDTWAVGNARTVANVTTTTGVATDADRREFALLLSGAGARVAPTDFEPCKRLVWTEDDEISQAPKVSLVSGLSQAPEKLPPLVGPIVRWSADLSRRTPRSLPGSVRFVANTWPANVKGDVVASNHWKTGLEADLGAEEMSGYALRVLQCVAAAAPTKALNLQAVLRHTDTSGPTGKSSVQVSLVTTMDGPQNLGVVLQELRRCVVDIVPVPRLQRFSVREAFALCEHQREDAVKPVVFIRNAPAATSAPAATPVATPAASKT